MGNQETRTFDSPTGEKGDSRPDFPIGVAFGRYILLHRVGSGGMGVVYAAYDPELDRKIAIKILRREADCQANRQRQLTEAKAMARLSHPNVIRIFDVGEHEGRIFLAMEFGDGPTLRDWLAMETERPWQRVIQVFLSAARGLAAAHAADLVHRDFKPSNVIVKEDGSALLVDFGLADFTDGPELNPPRRLGTPAYLAPERFDGAVADARSDQFSFCAALYQALFRVLPFPASSPRRYLATVKRGDVAAPPSPSRVPAWLLEALLKGLRADPEDRYPNMATLIRNLDPAPRRARQRRWLSAAGLAFVTLAMLIALLALGSGRPHCPMTCLTGIWDVQVQEEIRSAFLAVDAELGADSFSRIAPRLDAYTRGLLALHQAACAATHQRGEQSERMFDLQTVCLETRLQEVRAITQTFRDATPRTLLEAAPLLEQLSPLDGCTDRSELANLVLPPKDPTARGEVERIRGIFEQAAIQLALETPTDLENLEFEIEAARTLDYPPLESRALYVLALLEAEQEAGFERATALLREALEAAIAGGDRLQQARVYAHLTEIQGFYSGNPEEAHWWAALAKASLRSLGPNQAETKDIVLTTLANFAWAQGDFEEAFSRLQENLEVGEQAWGPDDPRLAQTLGNLSMVALDLPEHQPEAIGFLERAVEVRRSAYGSRSPMTARSTMQLGVHYEIAGRYQESLDLTTVALQILEGVYGEDHSKLGQPLLVQASVLNAMDRPSEALPIAERAAQILGRTFGEDNMRFAAALQARGDSLRFLGRPELAVQEFARVHTIYRESLPHQHPEQIACLIRLGGAELDLGRLVEARARLEQAVNLAEAVSLMPRDELSLHTTLGLTYLELDQTDRAEYHLERALEVARPAADVALLAEARFSLARLVQGSDPLRAQNLAERALSALPVQASPRTGELRARVATWLRQPSSEGVLACR